MANFVGVTACNEPKVLDSKYDYFLGELARYKFPYDIAVETDSETKKLKIYGYDWFEIEWKLPTREYEWMGKEDEPEEKDNAFDSFLNLLSRVIEENCIIHSIGWIKCRYPLDARAIFIAPGEYPRFNNLGDRPAPDQKAEN
jgi:hypothetical protein